jgi:protein-tyrosine-phosphatase
MGVLAFGYFLAYIPFAALTSALSKGLVPGVDEEVGGLVLLPAAAIGVLLGMAGFLWFTGWWRAIGVREVRGRERRIPTPTMLAAGIAMAVIIGTTILNFTFVGVSILFMLLMMRAGTLGISPVFDLIRGKRVRGYAWAGLGLSLLAIVVALAGVDAYTLTLGAVLSLLAYLAGYVVRFRIMSRDAKTGDVAIDRRYFAGEQATAAVGLFAVCAVFALIGAGPQMQALREGFTEFLFTPEALLAILVGLFYSTLYVFGTLIYLDPREYAWSVPVNRASSVLSAAVASYALLWIVGADAPHPSTLIAAAIVLAAIAALSYPQLRDLVRGTAVTAPRRLVLFVCGGNTGRSPIAAALTRAELSGWDPRAADSVYATSAGVGVNLAGKPMAPAAVAALAELGIKPHPHGSQELTAKLCEQASVIYCMTEEQRQTVLEIAPFAAERTFRLDPDGDLAEPEHGSLEAWSAFATRVRELVGERLADLPAPEPATGAA